MSEDEIRVLVVAAWPAVRAGLRALLEGIDGIAVAGEITPEALAGGEWPGAVDALVIDVDDDHGAGLTVDEGFPDLPAVLLAADPADYRGMTERDVPRAYLLRRAGADEIAVAVQAVVRGLVVLDPVVARALRARSPVPVRSGDGELAEPLTDREMDVLRELALGLPNKAIALHLGISDHTVKFHVGAILAKLGAAGRTEAVMVAARRGLLPL